MNPLVSVLVPSYNVELYLEKALRSIMDQSYSNLEILVINDGATDSSPSIAKKLAEEDSRIRLITQENGGYGRAMNHGLQEAKGDYISIVEPDDWIQENMIETLLTEIIRIKVPVIQGSFYYVWEKKGVFTQSESLAIRNINPQAPLKINEDDRVWRRQCTIWAGLYSKEFLDNYQISFETTPGASFQDFPFFYRVLFWADEISLLDIPFYYYRQTNPNSSIHNNKLGLYVVANTRKLLKDLETEDPKRFQEKLPFLLLTRIDNYAYFLKHANKQKEFFNSLLTEMKKDINSYPLDALLLRKLNKSSSHFYLFMINEPSSEKIRRYYLNWDIRRTFFQKGIKILSRVKKLLNKLNPLPRLRVK